MAYRLGLKKIDELKPSVLVEETKNIVEIIVKEKEKKQLFELLKKLLKVIKEKTCGEDRESIALAFYEQDCISVLIENFHLLEFETRKVVAGIIVSLLSVRIDDRNLALESMKKDGKILETLIKGMENPENSRLMSEVVIESCTLHPEAVGLVLKLSNFYDLFKYLRTNNFEIATEAHRVAVILFGKHKGVTKEYIVENLDTFFDNFTKCLGEGSNYMVKRKCTTLLCELLMADKYREIMFKFINKEKYLKVIMSLLTSKAENIRYEAFHIFKLFVGNPKKKEEVCLCLKRNKSNLLTFFETFPGKEKELESIGLKEDRKYVVKKIKNLDEEYKKSLLKQQKHNKDKKDDEEDEGEIEQ